MKEKNGKLLIVDDNVSVLNSLKLFLQFEFDEVRTLKHPQGIPSVLQKEDFDVILLDMNFTAGKSTGAEGLFWLKEILQVDPDAVVVMITAYGDVELAVKAIREGAVDFVTKPWENKKLITTLKTAQQLWQSRKEIRSLREKKRHLQQDLEREYSRILGNSESMKKVIQTINKVAETEANVLILGENGTGKELIARAIHRLSGRKNEIFSSLDLGTITETLFESELFGHVKGAFTDAFEDRTGRIETASGGTLFLDEIANLTPTLQSKLLTTLQSRKINRVGSNKSIPVDVRLICATNKNLKELIQAGLFRDDLYYRINTIEIEVPPLRERGDDIVLLAEHYLEYFADKYGRPTPKLTRKAIDQLTSYSWPGNVRELKHTMEKAIILNDSGVLHPDDFMSHSQVVNLKENLRTLEEIEKESIRNALKNNRGNLSKTARQLKIARQTLYNKMTKYGI